MRIFDTKYFIDKNRVLIDAYYSDITDVTDPQSLRSLLELRLYHLPAYFNTPAKTKVVLNNLIRRTDMVLEYELLHANSDITDVQTREICPMCSLKRQLVHLHADHEYCVECWSHLLDHIHALWKARITWSKQAPLKAFAMHEYFYESEKVAGFEWFWDIEVWKDLASLESYTQMKLAFKHIVRAKRMQSNSLEECISPKKTLLAYLIGCNSCGAHHPIETIWTSPASDWMDGLCPDCRSNTRGSWHLSKYEPVGYDECVGCGTTGTPYALWGMCEECYINWQDSYLDPHALYELAKEIGITALLLIRPGNQWIAYMKQNLPNSYTERKPNLALMRLIPRVHINIKESVCSIVSAS